MRATLVLAMATMAVACGPAPEMPKTNTVVAAEPGPGSAPLIPTPSPAPTPSPTPTIPPPMQLVPPAPDSAQAAANVVRRYFDFVARADYDAAYRQWEPGAAGMTRDAFARSFAGYAAYAAEVGAPGRVEPGAGQRYVTVPVRITARLTTGGRVATAGPVVLHRVAEGIDGTTPEQRRWRIRSADLKPQP